ncbi:hypothetical protein COU59_02220 [Candidatus Pacearchaeota archaeon CG10_big_fil_rev_8_21_14_0_10_34_12]|nr:MAG: hypothetical protein COU59_02220 [Candidatus Pacearchaeota archaeon CG10_big_fil_rev_8_21_14_0_10_34_12]
MKSYTNQHKRVKYTEQTAILLSKKEKELLEKIKFTLKGTNSQVFRLALSKLGEELNVNLDIHKEEENEGL